MAAHVEMDLHDLERKLLAMAGHAQSAAETAVRALLHRENALATKVIQDDDILDRFEIEVDELSIELLAKATIPADFLFIAAAMKISHNLERVGDEATTIARRTLALNREPFEINAAIGRISELVLHMLSEAMESFVERKSSQALSLIARDKKVDALNKEIHRELIAHMTREPSAISQCLDVMAISKSLERIADHATNIAEEAVHLCDGVDVRFDPRLKQRTAPPDCAASTGPEAC